MSLSENRTEYRLFFALFGVGATLAAVLLACQKETTDWLPLIPDGKADIVVVFESGVTAQDIEMFDTEVLIQGNLDRGFWHRPGIDGTMRVEVDGHSAYAIMFDSTATTKQRQEIIRRINGSPIVYRVFENASPDRLVFGSDQS